MARIRFEAVVLEATLPAGFVKAQLFAPWGAARRPGNHADLLMLVRHVCLRVSRPFVSPGPRWLKSRFFRRLRGLLSAKSYFSFDSLQD